MQTVIFPFLFGAKASQHRTEDFKSLQIYRIYQLTRSVHFVEKLMFSMSGTPVTPELFDRSGALVAMIVTFQVLGVMCLWSLLTFLQRLFPSRPVSENY